MTKSTKLLLAGGIGAAVYGVFFWRQHGTNPTLFDQWRARAAVAPAPPPGMALNVLTNKYEPITVPQGGYLG